MKDENFKKLIEARGKGYTFVFNCSPSLGILDSWISVIYELKQKLPEAEFILFYPKELLPINIKNTKGLLSLAGDVFDKIIYQNHFDILINKNFGYIFEYENIYITNYLYFQRKVFNKLKLSFLENILKKAYLFYMKKFRKNEIFDISTLEADKTVLLFDIYETTKEYAKPLLEQLQISKKYSILHGNNIHSEENANEYHPLVKIENIISYAFSKSEVGFFQKAYGLKKEEIRAYGIPRNDKKWIDFILTKVETDIPFEKDYIFVISRSSGAASPKDIKIEYIKEIKQLAKRYNLKIVVKAHPKERDAKRIYEEALGKNSYGVDWVFSTSHPVAIAKNCTFAVSYYSGVPVDLIMQGIPTIERFNYGNTKGFKLPTFGGKTKGDITEWNYYGVVLGAKDFNEFEYQVDRIMKNRKEVVEELQNNYKKCLTYTENINEIIANEIISELR